MEAKLYQIELSKGGSCKVFCANKNQSQRLFKNFNWLKENNQATEIKCISNGIHAIKEFEESILTIKNNEHE